MLAHELVHVAQQAMVSSSGHVGRPQHKADELLSTMDAWEYFDVRPSFNDVTARYDSGGATSTRIRTIEGWFGGTVGAASWTNDTAAVDKVQALRDATGFSSEPAALRALTADILKGSGRHEAAAKVYTDSGGASLATSFRSKGTYEQARKGLGWLGGARASHTFLAGAKTRLVEEWRQFFFSGDFESLHSSALEDEITSSEASTIDRDSLARYPNELVAGAMAATYLTSTHRRDQLRARWDYWTKKADRAWEWSVVNYRWQIATDVAHAKSSADAWKSTIPEVGAIQADAWPEIQRVAKLAESHWGTTKKLRSVVEATDQALPGLLTAAEVDQLVKDAKAAAWFKPIPVLLEAAAKDLLTSDPTVPSPADYDALVDRHGALLEAQAELLEPDIDAAAAGGTLSTPATLGRSLLVWYLRGLERAMDRYDTSRDTDHGDARLANRLRLAFQFRALSAKGALDLQSVSRTVHGFLGWRPKLAIVGEYRFSRYIDDPNAVGSDELLTGTGLKERDLAWFAYARRQRKLAETLDDIVSERTGDFEVKDKFIYAEALDRIGNFGLPEVYAVWDWVAWYDKKMSVQDKGGVTTIVPERLFAAAVFENPKTQALTLARPKLLATAPRHAPDDGKPLEVKFFPLVPELVEQLQNDLPALDAEVRTSSGFASPSWDLWLFALQQLGRTKKEKAKDIKSQALTKSLEPHDDAARAQLQSSERVATTHDRRAIVDSLLRGWISEYDRFDITGHRLMTNVFDWMRNFVRLVAPARDRPLQAAALALEVSTELIDALGSNPYRWPHSVVGTLHRLTKGTLAVWSTQKADILSIKRDDLENGDYEDRATKLTQFAEYIEKAQLKIRSDRGFHGSATDKSLTIPNLPAAKLVAPDGTFVWGGLQYMLTEVHRDFVFLPRIGLAQTLGVTWSGSANDVAEAMTVDASGAVIPDGTELATLLVAPPEGSKTRAPEIPLLILKAGDDAVLEDFTDSLGNAFGLAYIEAVGVIIGKGLELVLEIVEFVPGIGQGVMAARFIATVISLLTDAQIKGIITAIGDKGVGAFTEKFDEIKGLIEPEKIIGFLLFRASGDVSQVFPLKPRNDDAQKAAIPKRTGTWARVVRAAHNVLEVGIRLLTSLARVRRIAQRPFRAAQVTVATNPGLNMLLGLIVDNVDRLSRIDFSMLATSADDLAEADFAAQAQEVATHGVQAVYDLTGTVIETLREFQLPEEIFPLEAFVELIIDLAISRLGAKYKIGFRASEAVLRKLGLWDKIISAATDPLKQWGDPNDLYRALVRSHVEPRLEEVRSGLLTAVPEILGKVPFMDKTKLTKPSAPPIKVDLSGDDFNEAQPFIKDGPVRPRTTGPAAGPQLGAPSLRLGTGRPLPTATRERAETGLGHDLTHVRLHQGADADRVVQALGAEAITSGSHVFMRSGLPREGATAGVLHHELVHVVQQTGPRPLDGLQSSVPELGTPGRGLVVDADLEAMAERGARRVKVPVQRDPLSVPRRGTGVQPFMGAKLLRSMLTELRDASEIHAEGDVSELESKTALARIRASRDENALQVAEKMNTILFSAINALPASSFDKPFGDVRAELVAHFLAAKTRLGRAIPHIVNRTRDTVAPKMAAAKKADKHAKPVSYLGPDAFELALRRQIFATTGLAVTFQLRTKDAPPELGTRKLIDITPPAGKQVVEKLQVHYVHLPFLNDEADKAGLWAKLVAKTFPALTTASDRQEHLVATQLVLSRLVPQPGAILKRDFMLSSRLKRTVSKQVSDLALRTDKTQSWPSPAQYGNHKTKKDGNGLRVGTYGQWVPKTPDDRDPHHTVQYLVLQYLRNKHDKRMPFPLLSTLPKEHAALGIDATGAEVDMIANGGDKIDLAKLDTGDRGDGMPVIMVSTHAHRADIHLRGETPDEEPANRKNSQGANVDNKFIDALSAPHQAALGKGDAQARKNAPLALKDLRSQTSDRDQLDIGGGKVSRASLKVGIIDAIRKTYADAWSEMQPRLRRGLQVQEVEYYNTVAKLRGSSDRLVWETHVKPAHDEVVDKTNKAYQGIGLSK
mgnify:CR=1 FL=1